MSAQMRILTGDTPTGNLHLGHWVGSIRRRVEMQDQAECYFLIANLHAYTTRADTPGEIHSDCIEVARDALSMGVDPEKAAIFAARVASTGAAGFTGCCCWCCIAIAGAIG